MDNRRPRVVFDTNVSVSAFGWAGKPEECWLLAIDDEIESVTSNPIIFEVRRVLDYDRLDFDPDGVLSFIAVIHEVSTIVEPTESIEAVDDDPDDDKFLEAAVEADADYIISGDGHLSGIEEFHGIEIVSPAEFLDRIG